MAIILIIVGVVLFIIGVAERRGSVSHEYDRMKKGREKIRIGDKEYWV